jgi:hypothetical protein
MKSVLDSPNVVRDQLLARYVQGGRPKLTKEQYRSSRKKIVPPQETFQGYQRSGMLLFNNIANLDTNAFQNN